MRIIHAPFLKVNAMALYPFVLVREKHFKSNETLLNHEKIHLRQERELLILPFYFAYLSHYIYNRFKGMGHDTAYRNIIFEREAYKHEADFAYLKSRKFCAWRKA